MGIDLYTNNYTPFDKAMMVWGIVNAQLNSKCDEGLIWVFITLKEGIV